MPEQLVEVSEVSAGYGPHELTLHGVSLTIGVGESVGLVGESGSGKTTLAKVIMGLVALRSGSMRICDREWGKRPARDPMRRRVQMVFQDPYGSLNPKLTAEEVVADSFHRWNRGSRRSALEQAAACSMKWGCRRERCNREQHDSVVANANASASPGPWPAAPTFSWPTNRPRHWTFRCRHRFSI